MLRRCALRRVGKDTQTLVSESGSKLNALVVDYFRMAGELDVKFHVPVLVGTRKDGMRGLYVAPGHDVKRNSPLLTIPYRSFVRTPTLVGSPHAVKITVDDVRDALLDEEFHALAPQIFLAIQVGAYMESLPRATTDIAQAAEKVLLAEARGEALSDGAKAILAEYKDVVEHFTGGMMPWCRMTDDEDWNEKHIQEMYKPVLDTFQTTNYDDLVVKFNRNIANIQSKLMLPVKIDDIRRLTRVIIGRTEQVPVESEITAPPMLRRMRKWYRAIMKKPVEREHAIVPVAELINHSGRPNATFKFSVYDGVPALRVQSLGPIPAGREICRHYNFALDRSNSLFRYGFLPFETANVPELDQWRTHYLQDVYPNLGEMSEDEKRKQAEVQAEVDKLQAMFKKKSEAKRK